jgi:predicted amidohydrolase
MDAEPFGPNDSRLDPIVRACAETGSIALVGAPVWGEPGPNIAMLAIAGPASEIVYRKMNVATDESRFAPGAAPAVITIDGWRLGLGICRDTGLPEHINQTAQLNIDAYVAGTLMFAHERDIQDDRARRIATEHGIAVAFASFAGPTGAGYTDTAGRSGIWAADGRRLAQAGPEAGTIARATLRRSAISGG